MLHFKTIAYAALEAAETLTPLFIDHQMLGAQVYFATGIEPIAEASRQVFGDTITSTTLLTYTGPRMAPLSRPRPLGYDFLPHSIIQERYDEAVAAQRRFEAWQRNRNATSARLLGRLHLAQEASGRYPATGRKWAGRIEHYQKPTHSKTHPLREQLTGMVAQYVRAPSMIQLLKLHYFSESHYHHYGTLAQRPHFPEALRQGLGLLRLPANSTDKNLPWLKHPTFTDWIVGTPFGTYAQYLPHRSLTHEGRMAYCQSVQKFVRKDTATGDCKEPLYTVTSAGKFLVMLREKHGCPFTDAEIKELAEQFASYGTQTVHVLDNDDPKWANDARGLGREWYRLYNVIAVDYSCMRGIEAVKCYGLPGNHLRLIYWEGGDRLLSRAIARSDTMQYVRAYPSISARDNGLSLEVLGHKLTALGYAEGDLHGIHLKYIEDDDRTLCPYVDSGSGNSPYVKPSRLNGVSTLLIGDDGTDCQNSDEYGYLNSEDDEDQRTCDCCGRRGHDDDFSYSEYHDRTICDRCEENYMTAFVSARNSHQDWVEVDECIEVDGSWYVNDADVLNYHGIAQCEECDEYCKQDDLTYVCGDKYVCGCAITVALDDPLYGRKDHQYALREDAVETHDGRWILDDDAVTHTDGLVYHEDDELPEEEEDLEEAA